MTASNSPAIFLGVAVEISVQQSGHPQGIRKKYIFSKHQQNAAYFYCTLADHLAGPSFWKSTKFLHSLCLHTSGESLTTPYI